MAAARPGDIDVPPLPEGDIVIGRHYDLQDDLAPYPWPDMNGPGLPWPENMLGRWETDYGTVDSGLIIEQGKPIHIRVLYDDSLYRTIEYKIFRIEDGYVYAIIRATSFFVDPPNIRYEYGRFFYVDDPKHPKLRMGVKGCGLTEIDWKQAPQVHWKRLTRATCYSEDSFDRYSNTKTYYKR